MTRKLRQRLFTFVNRRIDHESTLKELRETGHVKMTLKRRLNTWLIVRLMGPGPSQPYSPSTNDECDLGSISWTVTDCKAGTVSQTVVTIPKLSTTQIMLMPSGLIGENQTKTIQLSEEYTLELHCSRLESAREGFALTSQNKTKHFFCWEWFTVEPSGRATKLQETGELELTFAKPKEQIDIIGCKFLSDIELRMKSMDYLKRTVETDEFEVRLTIHAGSELTLPILVDGLVRMP